jgi:hypothetical protein
MVNGDKLSPPGDHQTRAASAHPLIAALVCIVLAIGALSLVTALSSRPALGVPTAKLDPLYATECGSCHFAYHPSMGTALLWEGILGGLDHHFGKSIEMTEETRAALATYLKENSSEHWDTRIAHVLAKPNPNDPLRFTATRFWTRQHEDLPVALFAKKPIGFKGNCAACHQDAKQGLFAPQMIAVPEHLE